VFSITATLVHAAVFIASMNNTGLSDFAA